MSINREWVTPIAAGAFLLSAVTGVLMFFHLDRGFSKPAHEWLSWALLGGGLLHVAANFRGLANHLRRQRARLIVGAFAALLAASLLVPVGGERGEGGIPALEALAAAPLASVAPIAGLSEAQVIERLRGAGFDANSPRQTFNDLTGGEFRRRVQAMNAVFAPSGS